MSCPTSWWPAPPGQAASVVEVDLSRAAQRLEERPRAWQLRGIEPALRRFSPRRCWQALRDVPQANAAFDDRRHGHPPLSRRPPWPEPGQSGWRERPPRRGARRRHAQCALAWRWRFAHLRRAAPKPSRRCCSRRTVCLADYGPDSRLFAVPLVLPGQVAAIRVGAVEERLVVREHGFALGADGLCVRQHRPSRARRHGCRRAARGDEALPRRRPESAR